jgi:ubiquinone/menaquinone biosynthesis C-methylase UbiE
MLETLKRKLLFEEHVCPWWLAYTFDNRVRKIFHDPDKLFGNYIRKGMVILDIGCGMGYFSISMAKLSGNKGKVIALDIQKKMLEIMKKRANKEGVLDRIIPCLGKEDKLNVKTKVDFAVSFWMIHEVPDKRKFLNQVYKTLKAKGKYLIVEPKLHTGKKYFKELEGITHSAGFRVLARPAIAFSRAVLLGK